MAKKWKVLAPVVEVVDGDTAAEAIEALAGRLSAAGFDVYHGEPGCSVFESEPVEEDS